MRDLCEPSEPGGLDPLAQSVGRVLLDVYADADGAPPDRSHEFAFNVLLNSLLSVLESIRRDTPEEFGAYRQMMQVALNDD
jgi:hypothetical protein